MAFFRQYIVPLITLIIFLLAFAAVSARIFLPADLSAPAPIAKLAQNSQLKNEIFANNSLINATKRFYSH